jgi:hypothetical protein
MKITKMSTNKKILTLFMLFVAMVIIIITGLYLRRVGIITENFANTIRRPLLPRGKTQKMFLNQRTTNITKNRGGRIYLNN